MTTQLNSSSSREQFQAAIDVAADGDVLELGAFELEGPVHINKPLTLRGTGATIWARVGPTVTISSKGVRLQNLRLEIAGDDANPHLVDGCALEIKNDVSIILDNIMVRGRITGLAAEEGAWLYPLCLSLGGLTAGKSHEYRLRLHVPVPCEVVSEVYGVDIVPHRLNPGKNEVLLKIDSGLPRDTFISGYIMLISAYVKRQISISAQVLKDASSQDEARGDGLIYTPDNWDDYESVPASKTEPVVEVKKPTSKPIAPPPPVYPENAAERNKTTPPEPLRNADRRRFGDTSIPVSTLFSATSNQGPIQSASSSLPPRDDKINNSSKPISELFSVPSPVVATDFGFKSQQPSLGQESKLSSKHQGVPKIKPGATSIPSKIFGNREDSVQNGGDDAPVLLDENESSPVLAPNSSGRSSKRKVIAKPNGLFLKNDDAI